MAILQMRNQIQSDLLRLWDNQSHSSSIDHVLWCCVLCVVVQVPESLKRPDGNQSTGEKTKVQRVKSFVWGHTASDRAGTRVFVVWLQSCARRGWDLLLEGTRCGCTFVGRKEDVKGLIFLAWPWVLGKVNCPVPFSSHTPVAPMDDRVLFADAATKHSASTL